MEAKNMATPKEGARRGIFGMSARTGERTSTPALPRPDVRPSPVHPEQGKPPTKKSLIERLVRNLAVRIAFAGLALAAGTGLAIKTIVESNSQKTGVSENLKPPIFDTSAKDVIIGDDNIIDTTLQKVQSLPDFDKDGYPLILLATPSQGETAAYSRWAEDFRSFSSSSDPRTKIPDDLYNMIDIEVKANEPIPMPVTGYIFVLENKSRPGVIDGLQIYFQLSNNNIGFLLFYTGYTTTGLSEEVRDAPITKGGSHPLEDNNWKQGLLLEKGTDALIPFTNQHVKYLMQEINPATLEHIQSSIQASTMGGKLPRIIK